jgi:hypothetical protein
VNDKADAKARARSRTRASARWWVTAGRIAPRGAVDTAGIRTVLRILLPLRRNFTGGGGGAPAANPQCKEHDEPCRAEGSARMSDGAGANGVGPARMVMDGAVMSFA